MHVEGGTQSVGLKRSYASREKAAAAMGDLSCKPWALQIYEGNVSEGISEGMFSVAWW